MTMATASFNELFQEETVCCIHVALDTDHTACKIRDIQLRTGNECFWQSKNKFKTKLPIQYKDVIFSM